MASTEEVPRIAVSCGSVLTKNERTKANARHPPMDWLVFGSQSTGDGQTLIPNQLRATHEAYNYGHRQV